MNQQIKESMNKKIPESYSETLPRQLLKLVTAQSILSKLIETFNRKKNNDKGVPLLI